MRVGDEMVRDRTGTGRECGGVGGGAGFGLGDWSRTRRVAGLKRIRSVRDRVGVGGSGLGSTSDEKGEEPMLGIRAVAAIFTKM